MLKKNLYAIIFGIAMLPVVASAQEFIQDYVADDYINISGAVVTSDVISPAPVYAQYYFYPTYSYLLSGVPQPVVVINRYHGPYYYSPCPSYNLYLEIPQPEVYIGPSTDDNYCW